MPPLFSDPSHTLRALIVGVLIYAALVTFLRVSGKRTLSKMNAFDFIVTIALGSTLSSALLDEKLGLLHSVTVFALLISLQFLVSWTTVRSRRLRGLLRSRPTLLLHDGHYLHDALRDQRVTESDVRAAVRGAGVADLGDVLAVVLETDGGLSVVRRGSGGASALEDLLPVSTTA